MSVKFSVITMFPEFFESPLDVSLVGRARGAGLVDVELIPLRPYGLGRHQKLDGAPFGGGAGLVMRVEPLAAALEPLDRQPQGAVGGRRPPAHPGNA